MYSKNQIKELIFKNQESVIENTLKEVYAVFQLNVSESEQLNKIQAIMNNYKEIEKSFITNKDFDRWIDEKEIETANINAEEYINRGDIPEHLKKHCKEGFLVGFIKEHIRIYNNLLSMDEPKIKDFISSKIKN